MPTDPKSIPSNQEPEDNNSNKPEIFAVNGKANKPEFNRRHFLSASGVVVAGTIAASATGVSLAGNDFLQNPTRTPRPSATPNEPCTIRTTQDDVYVHVGPGRHRGILDYLPADEDFLVLGKGKDPNDEDGPFWWRIDLFDYKEAWVHPDDVEASGNCEAVEDADAPPFVPANTPKPKSTDVPPGVPGTVQPGQTGINYKGADGTTYTLPCGSPLPPNAVCICNCVTVPAACSCAGYNPCSCAGASHYWYPN